MKHLKNNLTNQIQKESTDNFKFQNTNSILAISFKWGKSRSRK